MPKAMTASGVGRWLTCCLASYAIGISALGASPGSAGAETVLRIVHESQFRWAVGLDEPIRTNAYRHILPTPLTDAKVAARLDAACHALADRRAEISDLLGDFFLALPLEHTCSYYEMIWNRVESIRRSEYARALDDIRVDIAATNVPFFLFWSEVADLGNATSQAREYEKRKHAKFGEQTPEGYPAYFVRFLFRGPIGGGPESWAPITLRATNIAISAVVKEAARQTHVRYTASSTAVCLGGLWSNWGNPSDTRYVLSIQGDASSGSLRVWQEIQGLQTAKGQPRRRRLAGLLCLVSTPEDMLVSDYDKKRILLVAQFGTRQDFDNWLVQFRLLFADSVIVVSGGEIPHPRVDQVRW